MTMRMVSHAAYTCDWCGAKRDGWLHELPEGWTAEHGELTTHHYCSGCDAPTTAQRNEPSDGEAA